jgi:hypothetical protein
MTRSEMIEILVGIARDEDVPATARVTAIRTLREFDDGVDEEPHDGGVFADLDTARSRRSRLTRQH